jgi:hypothetical protein
MEEVMDIWYLVTFGFVVFIILLYVFVVAAWKASNTPWRRRP